MSMAKQKRKTQIALSTKSGNKIVIVSKVGAILRVEKIELSESAKRSLTTGARSIGLPSDSSSQKGEPTKQES